MCKFCANTHTCRLMRLGFMNATEFAYVCDPARMAAISNNAAHNVTDSLGIKIEYRRYVLVCHTTGSHLEDDEGGSGNAKG